VKEISVTEFKAMRDAGRAHIVLDVREPFEIELAQLAGSLNIPMAEVPARLDEVPRDREIVVMCHSGQRSGRVARFLEQNGYTTAVNLAGGIDAWSREIDPAVPLY
jgi:rhodanese-related sulfurtransferase